MTWLGKSVLVVGATAGLATTSLRWLAKEGASLVLHGRERDTLQARREELAALGEGSVVTVEGDITSPELPEELWETLVELPGTPASFLCFVGVAGRIPSEAWTPDALSHIFSINCAGPLLACQIWAQRMKASRLSGNAVLFSTMQAQYPFEGSLVYSLGKVALEHGIRLLAKEFGPTVRVNGIAPGVNEAGMALPSIQRGKYAPYVEDGRIPRYGNLEDIQKAVAFLLEPELYMTGQTLLLDGGLTLRRDLARESR